MSEPSPPAGRTVDAGLSLLGRQLVDREGRLCGKVDDLEIGVDLSFDADLPAPSDPPPVTAILSGPGALAGQLGGRLGRWLAAVHMRLHHAENPGPARVPFGLVTDIGSHISLSADREDLASNLNEEWVRDTIISHIPGARHASE